MKAELIIYLVVFTEISIIDSLHKNKSKIEQIIVAFPSMYIRCMMQAMMIKEDVRQCKGPYGICLKSDMMLFLL